MANSCCVFSRRLARLLCTDAQFPDWVDNWARWAAGRRWRGELDDLRVHLVIEEEIIVRRRRRRREEVVI